MVYSAERRSPPGRHRVVRLGATVPGVRIDGVDDDGTLRLSSELAHGGDPEITVWHQGFETVRPLEAVRDTAGDLLLRLLVRPRADGPAPVQRPPGRDRGLVIPAGAVPEVRQRFAAYAVVRSSRGLLATEYSARTAVHGRWGMPGGGLNEGEEPAAAALREVHEETSQQVELGELVRVQTSHWVGRSPRSTLEDFHAVRLVYRATCRHPGEPVVIDTGGTTETARWVPLRSWATLPWTENWRSMLTDLLGDGGSTPVTDRSPG